MERTIGNLGEEIRLHTDPYANLSQRIIERARSNAIYAIAPNLFSDTSKLPSNACDVGGGFFLLGPRGLHIMEGLVFDAFKRFSLTERWQIREENSLSVDRFARLLLPNGQIARSLWHEKKRPDDKVRRARNVKVHHTFALNLFQEGS
jgi:hypothetical protein